MKPTWIGTFTARMGGWLAVQIAAFTVGNERYNVIRGLGERRNNQTLQGFKGVEGYSKDIGTAVAKISPKWLATPVHNFFEKMIARQKEPKAYQHYLEYTAMDVMYTAITAVTIKPFNNWLMTHIPFFRTERAAKKPSGGFKAISYFDKAEPATAGPLALPPLGQEPQADKAIPSPTVMKSLLMARPPNRFTRRRSDNEHAATVSHGYSAASSSYACCGT